MAHPVDVHVGKRVRQRRWMLGVTQDQLSARAGAELQRIQEYETGAGCISARQMWNIASALEVPVSYFFEGLDGQAGDAGEARAEILTEEETLELVRANYTIAAEVSGQARADQVASIANDRSRTIIPAEVTTQLRAHRTWPEAQYYMGQSQAVNETAPVPAPGERVGLVAREHTKTFARYCGNLGRAVMAPLFAASQIPKKSVALFF